jgi:hypothetical protein
MFLFFRWIECRTVVLDVGGEGEQRLADCCWRLSTESSSQIGRDAGFHPVKVFMVRLIS